MSSQDAKRGSEPGRRMSRRSLLQGAATAGAAGLAATTLGVAGPALAGPAQRPAADLPRQAATVAGPIVVHVRDAKTGDIEVFHGTGQTRLRDADLAARIARALG